MQRETVLFHEQFVKLVLFAQASVRAFGERRNPENFLTCLVQINSFDCFPYVLQHKDILHESSVLPD